MLTAEAADCRASHNARWCAQGPHRCGTDGFAGRLRSGHCTARPCHLSVAALVAREAMLDAEIGPKLVELMLSRGRALAPPPDGLFRYSVALRHYPCRVCARLDRSPDLRRGRCLLVKRNHHVASPSRTPRKIDSALKSADRRGSI